VGRDAVEPLLRVSDIAALSRLARVHGALLGCDNTFASPILQRPFEFGADLVMHSTTKYLGGTATYLAESSCCERPDPV